MKKLINIILLILLLNPITVNNAQSISNNIGPSNNSGSSSTFWTYSKWIFSGIAVGSIGGRFYFEDAYKTALTDYNNATLPQVAETKRNEVEKNVNLTNTSLIVGAISVGIALISWILDSGSDETPKQQYLPQKREEKKPELPPVLASSNIRFSETSGDNFLDAGESANISLDITNQGKGTAFNLNPTLKFSNSNITNSLENPIKDLRPGESEEISFTISANDKLTDGNTSFEIIVYEDNGFDLTPSVKITIPTKRFIPPKLVITDVAIKDNNNNRKIDLAEIVEVTARIQNIGEGNAKDVKADIEKGENIFFTADSKTSFELGTINSGEYKDVVFSIYTNMRATALDLTLNIREQRTANSIKQKLDLALNRIENQSEELVITGTEKEKKEYLLSTLNSDVDINIPETILKNTDAVAVIIGNRNYTNPNVPAVDNAINDVNIIKEYLIKSLGYDEAQIIYEPDATQSKFVSIFGTEKNFKGKLFNYVKSEKSDIFIFYSGHGAPDPESKQGYFVPVDCDPSTVSLNGYSLNTLYQNLSKINYKSLTVAIDACFSGSFDKGMLLKNISPVFISVENPVMTKENTVVFTSASGDQVSSWYPEKKHSLFTYYFLKALQGAGDANKDKQLTVGEIKQYIDDNVPYMARRLNNREQTPQVIGDENKVILEY